MLLSVFLFWCAEKKGHRKKEAHRFWKRGGKKKKKRGTIFLSNYETNIIDTNQLLLTFMQQTFNSVGILLIQINFYLRKSL